MKQLFFIFLFITTSAIGQELKLVKAFKITINAGATPTSTINYTVLLEKNKNFNWSVDSVVNVISQKKVKHSIVKVNKKDNMIKPDYEQVKTFSKKDKGVYQITFSVTVSHSGGIPHPGAPINMQLPVQEFSQGAILYYTCKKKTKKLEIKSFEQLETIDAP